MDKKNKIEVSVADGIKELVIREGEAQELFNPEQVRLNGTLESAQTYWKIRSPYHQKENCYVTFSADKMFLNLRCEEKYRLGTEVCGSLIHNPELSKLGINGNAGYTLTALRDKLKFMRTYFKELDTYTVLMGNLAKFSASVQSQIEKETSDRGNKKDNFEVKVDSNLAMEFVLSMPLFKGTPKSEFKVDICFDIREKNIEVWMESVELRDLQIQQAEKMIGDQVLYFQSAGLVTIEV